MIGTAADKFSPDTFVDRAQLAVCLVRTFDLNYDYLKLKKHLSPLIIMMMWKITCGIVSPQLLQAI